MSHRQNPEQHPHAAETANNNNPSIQANILEPEEQLVETAFDGNAASSGSGTSGSLKRGRMEDLLEAAEHHFVPPSESSSMPRVASAVSAESESRSRSSSMSHRLPGFRSLQISSLLTPDFPHGPPVNVNLPPIISSSSSAPTSSSDLLAHPIGFDQEVTMRVSSSTESAFVCPFEDCNCNRRVWFAGFTSRVEFDSHLLLHRCQWMLRHQQDGTYHGCMYIPSSNDDAATHMNHHLDHDLLPQVRTRVPNRVTYYCPWESCRSSSYCERGSHNRAHIVLHMKKHLYTSTSQQ